MTVPDPELLTVECGRVRSWQRSPSWLKRALTDVAQEASFVKGAGRAACPRPGLRLQREQVLVSQVEKETGAGKALKKSMCWVRGYLENHNTVVPLYPWRIASTATMDTRFWGCSSPFYKMAQYSQPSWWADRSLAGWSEDTEGQLYGLCLNIKFKKRSFTRWKCCTALALLQPFAFSTRGLVL